MENSNGKAALTAAYCADQPQHGRLRSWDDVFSASTRDENMKKVARMRAFYRLAKGAPGKAILM